MIDPIKHGRWALLTLVGLWLANLLTMFPTVMTTGCEGATFVGLLWAWASGQHGCLLCCLYSTEFLE